ncbi:MAG: hypothetical protein MUP98_03295 [Candidatus Aminicenantes bacterium]|nr:hypothetical protein [Candidatus Aminicenantes bacterium]
MKLLKTVGLMICLISSSLFGQKELPGMEDPAFESISTKYRVEYHYNKTTYTLYMPDANTPIVFKCKFKFFTTQRTTTTIGRVKHQIVKRKFDLTNVMNNEIYKVDTVVGETEIYDFFSIPDEGSIAIEKEGNLIAQYIKGRMRGSNIPFDLYIKNGMSEKEIADMMTIFICSHQLMLAFEDKDDTPSLN